MYPEVITRIILCIILHCSGTTGGNVKIINAWHIKQGFDEIGYHYLIKRDGTIEKGRNVNKEGAHTYGHNKNSIGVGVILAPKTQKLTKEQLKSLRGLFARLPKVPIYGHREFNKNKICPGNEAMKFIFKYKKRRNK